MTTALFGKEAKKNTRIHNPKHQPEMLAHKVKYKNALQLAKDIGTLDKDGQRVFAVVDGSFIFGDFIEAYLVTHNLLAKRMVISTLSMSQENVDSLKNLLTGDYLEQLDIVVSDYFYSHERHSLIKYMYEHLDINDSFQLAVCRTHTKITLIETECGKWLTIHGSANLRSSDNIEMFSIENSKDLYDFNLEWHDEIINKYQTINKMVRSLESWQAEVSNTNHTTLKGQQRQQSEQELKPAKSKAW
jgi:hypothetical protein